MALTVEQLEKNLNDFDGEVRRVALAALCERAEAGEVRFGEQRAAVNLHYHTSFSYNGYGYSPSAIAWRARCEGLWMAGCVDFDVLDGVDEFLEACRKVGLRGCAGMETRVYVPPFETREMNSPGEPGAAYYCGLGFTSGTAADAGLLAELKATAQQRNRRIMGRVNGFLSPVELDYERDVLSLTPNGNATERHLAAAYDLKARALMPDAAARAGYWAGKLGENVDTMRALFDDAPTFQGLIRSKTMKAGGAGYVKAKGADFPGLDRVSAFIIEMGAIPAYAFLDGMTDGERSLETLLDVAGEHGAAALNIIPDRNWNIKDAELKREKVANLYKAVEIAQSRDLPIVVGTEMNAYGQRFVDDFDAAELKPVVAAFIEGAAILYGHTLLQAEAGLGYLSDWANRAFASTKEKNAFYKKVGERLQPGREDMLAGVSAESTPEGILGRV